MQYIGVVKDRLQTMEARRTKKYDTYKEAHDAAEKLCERTMGERGTIDVEQIDTVNAYPLRDIPTDLWNAAKHRAVDEGLSLRELILKALGEYLST